MVTIDNKYGLFNKRTHLLTQITKKENKFLIFNSINDAKTFFYTDNALEVFKDCCAKIEWQLVDSKQSLKYTMAFGTKGGNILEIDDWAGQFNFRKQSLITKNNWARNPYTTTILEDHLF